VEVVKAMESLMVTPHHGYVVRHSHIYIHIPDGNADSYEVQMKQERLNLYLIDMKYVRNLHNVDDKVSSVSPQIGKQHRIYVGIVVLCNNRKYLIPLSHAVAKHAKMKPRADFDKIFDKKGKLIGVLNYNLMIPVEESQIYKVELKPEVKDTVKERQYKQLCIDELSWCRKNQEIIVNKAKCLYDLCQGESGYKGKDRCLNFAKLEQVCDKYNCK
jgi:protein AbiQ